jgi:hypothetical protein
MSCGSIAAAGHVSVIRDLTDDQVGSGTVRTRIGLRYLYGRLTCLVVVGVNTIPCTSGQGGGGRLPRGRGSYVPSETDGTAGPPTHQARRGRRAGSASPGPGALSFL